MSDSGQYIHAGEHHHGGCCRQGVDESGTASHVNVGVGDLLIGVETELKANKERTGWTGWAVLQNNQTVVGTK